MEQYKFKIENLDCANCANELERALNKAKVIKNVRINFITQKLIFECNENDKNDALETIKKIIKKEDSDIIIKEN